MKQNNNIQLKKKNYNKQIQQYDTIKIHDIIAQETYNNRKI